jgi:hypothetical protein
MPTVADYVVILGGKKDGTLAGDELTFNLPNSVVAGDRSIVTFTYYAFGDPAHIDIEVNGLGVGWYEFQDVFGTFSRPLSANVLKSGKNVIRFIVTHLGDNYVAVALYHVMLTFHKTV